MKDNAPLVSVVVPCFNHEKFVRECIQSIIEQDYKNIELIVIDDGSKDNSVNIIKKIVPDCEERFSRFEFRYRENKGLSETLNEALFWCQGEFLNVLASDDKIFPFKISLQIKELINRGEKCVGVFGKALKIDKTSKEIGVINRQKKIKIYHFYDVLMHRHNLPACTQLIRIDNVKKVGGFKSGIEIEDWYMWLKLLESGGYFVSLPVNFSSYRVHGENFSQNYKRMMHGRLAILELSDWGGGDQKRKALSICFLCSSIDSNDIRYKIFNIFKSIKIDWRVIFEKKFLIAIFSLIKK